MKKIYSPEKGWHLVNEEKVILEENELDIDGIPYPMYEHFIKMDKILQILMREYKTEGTTFLYLKELKSNLNSIAKMSKKQN